MKTKNFEGRKGEQIMAKGWTTIKTNALGGVDKKTVKAFDKAIRNTVPMSAIKMKLHGDFLFDTKIAEEDKLLAAVKAGKVSNEKTLAKAKAIEKKRNKAKARQEKKDGVQHQAGE